MPELTKSEHHQVQSPKEQGFPSEMLQLLKKHLNEELTAAAWKLHCAKLQ